MNGSDVMGKSKNRYLIDLGVDVTEDDASRFECPFHHVRTKVIPKRTAKHFEDYPYWILWNPRPAMKKR